jgi:hypothetical protein
MNKIGYSPTENKMLELLRKYGELDTEQLTNKHYGARERPWHAKIVINSAMRVLAAKIARNKEPFTIEASKPAGQGPMSYKIIKTKR